MTTITFEQIPELFDKVGALFIEKKEELCNMDAKLGDGDLGLTMSKGYGSTRCCSSSCQTTIRRHWMSVRANCRRWFRHG